MSWSQSRARARSQSRFQSQSQSRSESRSKSQSWQLGGCQGSRRCRCRSPFPLSSGLLCLYAIVLFILAHCTTVQAGVAQDSVIWIYPEGGEMFYYLDTVNVTYQSSLGDLWLFIICYKDKTVDSLTESSSIPSTYPLAPYIRHPSSELFYSLSPVTAWSWLN